MKSQYNTVEAQDLNLGNLKLILNDPNKAIRLGIFNADRHIDKKAFSRWEEAEPGSTNGIIQAYHQMAESIHTELSCAVFNQIRLQFFDGRQQYGNRHVRMQASINDIGKPCGFSISSKKATSEELEQLNKDALALQQELGLPTLPYHYDTLSKTVTGAGSVIMAGSEEKTSNSAEIVEGYINKIIERYNTKNNADSLSEENRLDNILELSRDLERVHPYMDFNCRTFNVLILNRELIKNGFAPCIMEDPNVFDYKNLTDLRALVIDGQQNFKSLLETGLVHAKDPSNQQWYNAITSWQTQEQFHKVTHQQYQELDKLNGYTFTELLGLDADRLQTKGINIQHVQQIENLADAGFNWQHLVDLHHQDQEMANLLTQHSDQVRKFNQSILSGTNLIQLCKAKPEAAKFIVASAEQVATLSKANINIDDLAKLYEAKPELAKLMLKSADEIASSPLLHFSDLVVHYEQKLGDIETHKKQLAAHKAQLRKTFRANLQPEELVPEIQDTIQKSDNNIHELLQPEKSLYVQQTQVPIKPMVPQNQELMTREKDITQLKTRLQDLSQKEHGYMEREGLRREFRKLDKSLSVELSHQAQARKIVHALQNHGGKIHNTKTQSSYSYMYSIKKAQQPKDRGI